MRITLGMLTSRVRADLMQNAERLVDAQIRASTGKRITRPSDDVPGIGRDIRLRSALASIEQYDRNSNIASNLLSVTNHALNSVVGKVQDIRRLALTAASANLNEEARSGIVTQLEQISVELQSTANTQYLGRYIFSGSVSDAQAIVDNPSGTPPRLFQGDDLAFNTQVAPGTYITANVTADKLFNMGGAVNPATDDLFQTIQTLKELITAGDVGAISDAIADIDAHLNNVTAIRSQVGGRVNRLESANQILQDSKLKIKELLSLTEDADLAESLIDLQVRQNLYQSAIQVAARVIDLSLANSWPTR